ncbi:hypothetical protein [Mycobacterium scrofulaceum]|uniref:hypothetical protein n=1 Tax=Mycobacterium scrofulaceum TaxID=1783 RepID=UPI001E430C2C|nr:hypothetical protein [Mycobacterium scrofulaceum]
MTSTEAPMPRHWTSWSAKTLPANVSESLCAAAAPAGVVVEVTEAPALDGGRWLQAVVGVLAARTMTATAAPLADIDLGKAESCPLQEPFASELRTDISEAPAA